MVRVTRKKIVTILALLLLSGLCLAFWAFVFEPRRLTVNPQTIRLADWPQGLQGLKIVLISDIHAGARYIDEAKLQRITAAANARQPDLILLAGDFVVGNESGARFMPPETIAQNLKGFRARLGVYAVMGNHDWWEGGPVIQRGLEQGGWRFLDNDAIRLELNGQAFWLAGIGDAWTNHDDISLALKKITDNSPILAFTHNPDLFTETPARINLLMAGHTHGGQCAFPLLGRPVVPSKFGQRFAIGHIVEDGRHLYVTPGIGTSVYPVRFRVPPEITVLTLE